MEIEYRAIKDEVERLRLKLAVSELKHELRAAKYENKKVLSE